MLAIGLEEGMRTLKQDGMEKVLHGRHRHQGSARGLHQVTGPTAPHGPMSATIDSSQGLRFAAGDARTAADDLGQRLEQLNAIGASLSAERDINRLLETILIAAKTITRADGGTLYRVTEDRTLRFEIMRTSSLKYYLGGTTGNPMPFYPIQLHDKDGKPNHSMVAAYAALTGKTVNIADAYTARGLRLLRHAQLRQEDRLPLEVLPHRADEEPRGRDHRRAAADQRPGPATGRDRRRSPTPTSAWPSRSPRRRRSRSPTGMLINQLEQLFESFINLINTAIDEKSPYTGGHCQRVPQLTMMLAEAVNETARGAARRLSA